jgi:hypothetical protein
MKSLTTMMFRHSQSRVTSDSPSFPPFSTPIPFLARKQVATVNVIAVMGELLEVWTPWPAQARSTPNRMLDPFISNVSSLMLLDLLCNIAQLCIPWSKLHEYHSWPQVESACQSVQDCCDTSMVNVVYQCAKRRWIHLSASQSKSLRMPVHLTVQANTLIGCFVHDCPKLTLYPLA